MSVTEKELKIPMGWGREGNAHELHYGSLGRKIAAALDIAPEKGKKGFAYFTHEDRDAQGNLRWTLYPNFARALVELGWVETAATPANDIEPEFGELLTQPGYREGVTRQVVVNAFERNPDARKKCIEYYRKCRNGRTLCEVCETSLIDFYGPIASGFIHVHHLKPLSEIRENYVVNPRTDLVPVCPNCHAMLHRREPPYTVQELRDFIQEAHR